MARNVRLLFFVADIVSATVMFVVLVISLIRADWGQAGIALGGCAMAIRLAALEAP